MGRDFPLSAWQDPPAHLIRCHMHISVHFPVANRNSATPPNGVQRYTSVAFIMALGCEAVEQQLKDLTLIDAPVSTICDQESGNGESDKHNDGKCFRLLALPLEVSPQHFAPFPDSLNSAVLMCN